MNKFLYIFTICAIPFVFSCKKETTAFKNKFSTYNQEQNIKSWTGKYSILIEDESLSDGSVSGRIWNFIINEKKILLETESYQEPIFCDGEYSYKFENNTLALYYNGTTENCKSSSANFYLKKEKNKFFISSLDFGNKYKGKWLLLKKQL